MYKIDLTAALIGIAFGIVTILALVFLRVQEAFIIVLFWLLIPLLIKRFIGFLKKLFKDDGKGFK